METGAVPQAIPVQQTHVLTNIYHRDRMSHAGALIGAVSKGLCPKNFSRLTPKNGEERESLPPLRGVRRAHFRASPLTYLLRQPLSAPFFNYPDCYSNSMRSVRSKSSLEPLALGY